MRTTISDFVIAFFDLLEAEGRAFKNNTEKIVEKTTKNFQKMIFNSSLSIFGIALVGFIFIIAIFAFGLGLFLWMKTFLSPYVSAFILSFIFLIIGCILLFIIKRNNE